jgi:hypothetical protein
MGERRMEGKSRKLSNREPIVRGDRRSGGTFCSLEFS